jgi:hypothetical protein
LQVSIGVKRLFKIITSSIKELDEGVIIFERKINPKKREQEFFAEDLQSIAYNQPTPAPPTSAPH